MYVCMYVCMYVSMYVCVCMYVYIYIYIEFKGMRVFGFCVSFLIPKGYNLNINPSIFTASNKNGLIPYNLPTPK